MMDVTLQKDTDTVKCSIQKQANTQTQYTHTHPHREPSSSPPTLSADRTIHFIFDSLCGHDELETWKESSELRRDSFYRSVFLSALLSLFPHSVHVCFFILSILHFLSHAYVHSCSLCNSDYLIFTFVSLSSPLFPLHLYTHNLPFTCVHLFLLIAVFYRSLFSSLLLSCFLIFSTPSLGDLADTGCCHLGMTRAAKRWIKHWTIHRNALSQSTCSRTHTFPQHTPLRHSCFCLQDLFLETRLSSFPSYVPSTHLHSRHPKRTTHKPLSTSDPPSSPSSLLLCLCSLHQSSLLLLENFIKEVQLRLARLVVAVATMLLILWSGHKRRARW